MRPPLLQVRDRTGSWRTIVEDIGFPVGRPQTLVVDLRGLVPALTRGAHRDQHAHATGIRFSWIAAAVMRPPARLAAVRAPPFCAWRGFSCRVSGDGREPHATITRASPARRRGRRCVGGYTREGDVRELLTRDSDDMFVIAMPGRRDRLSLRRRGVAAAHAGIGRARSCCIADGFSKEMNPRSATPDGLGPLPFHRMTRYPYGSDEAYPSTPAHRESLLRYQTRLIRTAVPPIETHDARAKN